jgi:iron-only hydrogenase group A
MPSIEVNNRQVEMQPGEMLLQTIRRAGVRVPTLCAMPGMDPSGACRICVVEVENYRGLVPSCCVPAVDGMKVKTHSPRAVKARKTVVELLLANHPEDCMYCPRDGSCQLQDLAIQHGIRERRFPGASQNQRVYDVSSPSLVRDPGKCVLCGKCVRVCEEVQGVSAIDFNGRGSQTVVGPAFGDGLNVSSCINCGQCVMACPTAALTEQSHVKNVLVAMRDPNRYVVVQHAPAVSVTLAETFGLPAGIDATGSLTAALRRLGFRKVFDTSFSADLTVMEEASELVQRITSGGALPMFTSCSPGWIKFVEQFYPDMIPNLSTCKSPQQMLGAIIKSHFAEKEGVDPSRIYTVSIMPCTAKKFEARRPEMVDGRLPDTDAVLTTRELVEIIHMHGLELGDLAPEEADTPFGLRSSAGKLFGATGGVMEAALRTAHHMITGRELGALELPALRGPTGIKETKVRVGDLELGVAVVSGLKNARKVLAEIRAGRKDLHFVEVMTCPGGCVAGGGQTLRANIDAVSARMKSLYAIDEASTLRTAHNNPAVKALYDEFLGKPLGERSHHFLHTHYQPRNVPI